MKITLFLIGWLVSFWMNPASEWKETRKNQEGQDSLNYIYLQDREKLSHFLKKQEGLTVLAIDSTTAVDSLKVAPWSYHDLKEILRWKKNYPVQDFLKLRESVQNINNRLILIVDSTTAVNCLKLHPQAYSDLKANLEDCNQVTAYQENMATLKKYFRKTEGKYTLTIDSITAVDSLKISPRVYQDVIDNISNHK